MSTAVELVGKLLDCYPNKSQAGRGYIGALASVLIAYPASIARRSSEPLNGVPSEKTFGLPTVADLVAWCERETAALRGIVEKEDHYGRLEREARERAAQEAAHTAARKARPTLDELKAKHGPAWGIGSAQDDQQAARDANLAQIDRANRRTFQRECEAAGVDPNGLASPTLRALLKPQRAEAAE